MTTRIQNLSDLQDRRIMMEKNNFGDYAMNALGIAAAVYNLGVAPTKNTVKETEVKFTV